LHITDGRKIRTEEAAVKITSTERVETDTHLEGNHAVRKARELLPSFQSTMLVTRAEAGDGLHMRPMGLMGDLSVFGGTLWFFTDDRSRKVREIRRNPAVSLVFQDDEHSRYMQLSGTATTVSDRAKMRELFSPIVRTWFPDGLEDPHLTLLRVDTTDGVFWDSPGGILRVLAAFTKAVVTRTPSKAGTTGTIDLHAE